MFQTYKAQLLRHVKDVNEICNPLFKKTIISNFNYSRYYKYGSIFTLASGPKYAMWYGDYSATGNLVSYVENVLLQRRNGVFLWSADIPKVLENARQYCLIQQPIVIMQEYKDYYEVCSFSVPPGLKKNELDFYFNNLDGLKKFILYFKERAAKILKESKQKNKRFVIPDFVISTVVSRGKIADIKHHKIAETIPIKKIYHEDILKNKCISPQELKSLLIFLMGRTYKEIGKTMEISEKTAESYIFKIKEKLNCYSRADLFDKAHVLGLFELIEWK